MGARSQSSQRWLQEHFADPFVAKAQEQGFRSRAVYKLQELDQREGILRSGMQVVDLGAAPGGWSQYAAARVGPGGKVIASDILPISPIPGVEVVTGDFREMEIVDRLREILHRKQADVVLSDMAPNFSGKDSVDQPRAMYLCELALDLAAEILKPDGVFLVKLFQGEGSDAFVDVIRKRFHKFKIRKPGASRPRSREVYLVARELRDV